MTKTELDRAVATHSPFDDELAVLNLDERAKCIAGGCLTPTAIRALLERVAREAYAMGVEAGIGAMNI